MENSIDSKTDNYREESGTKILQENIETITRQLGFMQEEHPIKWLKFQDRLELCKTRSSSSDDHGRGKAVSCTVQDH